LAAQLLGAEPQLGDLAARVADRAAGNPFFAEEMVRDLAERGVLDGQPGAYSLRGDIDDADVPATLHATIGARIDRLDPAAKRTLNAAAVVGSRFDDDLLASLLDAADVAPLIAAELVDQVRFGPLPEYAFRHALIARLPMNHNSNPIAHNYTDAWRRRLRIAIPTRLTRTRP
jgi:adenylate cyclase